ncbi:choice-of-anchor A family protein [Stigmatella erecta]|uniref:Choice-of-anchor A domain-containing protein n=1 Tax=Stigmatella erecta TaxID=83460 RepID=A0A1I0CLC6_9BACT|nr:choice-of-anchor A family protein [Stigmatella erecta]SET20272.1 choice-of-anchor A domain-containing protein [Stigmatella erecta]
MKNKSLGWWMVLSLSASACGMEDLSDQTSRDGASLQRPSITAERTSPPAGHATFGVEEEDYAPPESSIESFGIPDENGNYAGAVAMKISASDAGTGVKEIYYYFTGATTGSATVSGDTAYLPLIENPGLTTIIYYSRDNAGNVEEAKSIDINIVLEQPGVSCLPVKLGEYNLFVLGNYMNGHDVQGKVAAGGNVTLTSFAVGAGLPATNTHHVLVVGGNLNISNGAVYGDTYYGGTLTKASNATIRRGTLTQGTPFNFTALSADLQTLSSQLATQLEPTATPRIEPWGGLYLKGSNPTLNVFELNASIFASTRYMELEAPAGSRIVVNIRGPSASFSNFSQHNFRGGIDQTGVLYNFVDTTKINASSFGFWGTVLAPLADITFNNGSWDGGIYANSLTGTAEGHINPLKDFEFCEEGQNNY